MRAMCIKLYTSAQNFLLWILADGFFLSRYAFIIIAVRLSVRLLIWFVKNQIRLNN